MSLGFRSYFIDQHSHFTRVIIVKFVSVFHLLNILRGYLREISRANCIFHIIPKVWRKSGLTND